MGKRNGVNWKGNSDASAAPVTKKRFTAPTSGLEDVYLIWGTVSGAVRYTKVVNKLKEYVAVHFWDQATVAARVVEELRASVFVKMEHPLRMFWQIKIRLPKTTGKFL